MAVALRRLLPSLRRRIPKRAEEVGRWRNHGRVAEKSCGASHFVTVLPWLSQHGKSHTSVSVALPAVARPRVL